MPRHLPHFRYKFKEPLTNNTAVFMSKYTFSGHKSVVTVSIWAFLHSSNILTAPHGQSFCICRSFSFHETSQIIACDVEIQSLIKFFNLTALFFRLININGSLTRFKRKDFFSILGEHIHDMDTSHLIQDKTFVLGHLLKQAS